MLLEHDDPDWVQLHTQTIVTMLQTIRHWLSGGLSLLTVLEATFGARAYYTRQMA
jgi:hypothetical protein